MSVRRQKSGSFGFAKGRLCVLGQSQMCHLRSGLKLFLKKAGGEKIKNIGSAMSIGLLVVRSYYRFYVFGHLSKWFTFLSFFSRLLVVVGSSVTLAANGYVYETFGTSKHFPVKLQALLTRVEMLDNALTAKCFIYDVVRSAFIFFIILL